MSNMENKTSAAVAKGPRQRALLGVGAGVVLLVGVTAILYWMGRPAGWSPSVWTPSSSVEGFSLDRAVLSPKGDWLLWLDSSLQAVCAKDLSREVAVSALDPGEFFAVTPVAVVDTNLLALRSQRSSGFFDNLERGFQETLRWIGSIEDSADDSPSPETRTTYLESVDLRTGKTLARSPALTLQDALEEPSDFELGRVSFSPAGERFAYWSAQEEVASSPLEATVTEVLRVYDTGSGLKPRVDRTIASPGAFFLRSSLLSRLGQALWIGRDTCAFVSFLDSGSLIPVDVTRADLEATYSISEVYRRLTEENPNLRYGPEGIEVLSGGEEGQNSFLFWGRQQDSLHFFLFDSQLRLRRETVVETEGYHLETAVWLTRSERLLVDDKAKDRLVAVSPYGDSSESYPLPPDWRDGFRILGEDSTGALVGTNRRIFLRTSQDRRDWETIPLF